MRIGSVGGITRLRCVTAGQDAANLGLADRYVTFDSAVPNAFRVVKNGLVSGAALANRAINYSGLSGTGTRYAKAIPHTGVSTSGAPLKPAMVWQQSGAGSVQYFARGSASAGAGATLTYQRGYGVCTVSLKINEVLVSPARDAMNYAYFIFGSSPATSEGSGANGGRLGVHPLYGPSLNISRPGFDHLSCSLDDMMLTTKGHHFQIEEMGIAYPDTGGFTSGLTQTSMIANDPFPEFAGVVRTRLCALVNTAKSYPHYPPVMAYNADGAIQHPPSIFWISPTQFVIAGTPDAARGMRWAIVAGDPAYVPGPDTIRTHRIRMRPDALLISKHNVNVLSAGANDFVFRSDRLTPRFTGFAPVLSGYGSGFYSIPNPPPAGSTGFPFVFMSIWDVDITGGGSGWWCGVGMVQSADIIATTPGMPSSPYYTLMFRASIENSTQYDWYKNPSISGSQPFGYMATINLYDF